GARAEGVALPATSATLGGRRGGWRGRAAVTELTEAGLEEGLQAGAVLALERAQLVDLLLQRGAFRLDLTEDLVVLPLGVALQGGGLLPGLTFQGLGPGPGVVEHGLGAGAGLVDHRVGLRPCLGEQLLGLGARLAEHAVRLGLGL